MKGYKNKVNTLAGSKKKSEVSLVVNLFQSVLDGFIRGEEKRAHSEPAKVSLRISANHQSLNYLVSISYHLTHSYLISGFFQTTKTTKKRKKDICVSCISLPALWSFCVIHPVKSSQCIVCTSSLYSLIVLWITSSAHTRWTLCSHVTCVAPTSGEWRKLTCAAVSSKSCKATKCNIKKKTQEWHN